jgi:hypothetical protein
MKELFDELMRYISTANAGTIAALIGVVASLLGSLMASRFAFKFRSVGLPSDEENFEEAVRAPEIKNAIDRQEGVARSLTVSLLSFATRYRKYPAKPSTKWCDTESEMARWRPTLKYTSHQVITAGPHKSGAPAGPAHTILSPHVGSRESRHSS